MGNNHHNDYNKKHPSIMEYKELTDDSYVNHAENVIKYLNRNYKQILTTSQIRNLLSLNSEIYNMVMMENKNELSEHIKSKLQYLKVRMVYDSGRSEEVKAFVLNSHLIDHIDQIGNSKEKYLKFSKYMEALVAYRKFEGKSSDSD